MSNALAIASVTAVLKDVLNDGLLNRNLDGLFGFQVTAQPPDRIGTDGDFNRLNLFLYRVTPNTGWTNQRLPARASSGIPTDNPYLALDLHYLLSAFSSEDLNAEILLGFGMQVLHEIPVLGRDAVRQALGAGGPLSGGILPPAFQQLSPADLADQFEQIKISPYYTDLEEISKIWMAMNSPMRMSALYQVSVVLIESHAPVRSALPVRQRGLFLRQLRRPQLQRILSMGQGQPEFVAGRQIVHGNTLRLEGVNLRGDVTIVGLGELEVAPATVTGDEVTVAVPAGLHPGVVGTAIIHRIPKRPPSLEQMPGEMSNLLAFVLHPSLAAVNAITVSNTALEDNNNTTGPMRGRIHVALGHNVGGRQRADILLNEAAPPTGRVARAYSFTAVPLAGNPPPLEVAAHDFEFRNVEQGTYLLRVRIDGAESALTMAGGVYNGPVVTIP